MADPTADAQLIYLAKIDKHLATIKACMVILTALIAIVIVQLA